MSLHVTTVIGECMAVHSDAASDAIDINSLEEKHCVLANTVWMLGVFDMMADQESIDAVLLNLPSTWDTEHRKLKEVKAFLQAVKDVAGRHHLRKEWFNDDCPCFLGEYTPHPEYAHWKTFGKLEVSIVTDRCLLAQKIMSY